MIKAANRAGVVKSIAISRNRLIVAFAALIVVALYVGSAALFAEAGFPLDDSWIHQTYARNLIRSGRWEYVSGVVSAGSTAPLWTLMLSAGYLFPMSFFVWAYFLGWLCLVWLAWSGISLWESLWPQWSSQSCLAGVTLVFSWPLVWAAASGMETVLFMALAMQILLLYSRCILERREHAGLIGFLSGLLVLARPEGLGLLLLIAVGLLALSGNGAARFRRLFIYLGSAALPLIPYFAFNHASGGTLWPNTFYAKQAEYAFLWEQPIVYRYLNLLYFTLGGPAEGLRGLSGARLLLLPGLIISILNAILLDMRHRQLLYTIPVLWFVGHIFAYAWRLPVVYQHGRYLWPVLPILILYGLAGWKEIFEQVDLRFRSQPRVYYLAVRIFNLTFAVLMFVFLLLGLQAYLQDVQMINGEMLKTSLWLKENTESDTLIAAHDIGAIGYFAERPLLDLAGLISPDVVSLLADEQAISDYVHASGAEYIVTAPGWTYDSLTTGANVKLVFKSNFSATISSGLNNMAVYQIKG
jgi:hypothetical protein